MKLKPISPEERKNAKCYFCGTDKSVKYIVRVFEDDSIEDINHRPCCNKCALMFNDQLKEF